MNTIFVGLMTLMPAIVTLVFVIGVPIVLAVLLLVPLVYVVLAALDVQRTVFGATQAAREAGRFMAEVVAPTNRVGDEQGATMEADGSVTVAPEIKKAYEAVKAARGMR